MEKKISNVTMSFYEFKRNVELVNSNKYYFSPDTLKFFGERLSEMYLLNHTIIMPDEYGTKHECYILSVRRKDYQGRKYRTYEYFDVDTFERIVNSLYI